jgi:hypothetical protein
MVRSGAGFRESELTSACFECCQRSFDRAEFLEIDGRFITRTVVYRVIASGTNETGNRRLAYYETAYPSSTTRILCGFEDSLNNIFTNKWNGTGINVDEGGYTFPCFDHVRFDLTEQSGDHVNYSVYQIARDKIRIEGGEVPRVFIYVEPGKWDPQFIEQIRSQMYKDAHR